MILDEIELKQRYSQYLREVEQEQIHKQLKANKSKAHNHILLRLGDIFITAGQRLQAQNKSQTNLQNV